jgi:hypothetical protein
MRVKSIDSVFSVMPRSNISVCIKCHKAYKVPSPTRSEACTLLCEDLGLLKVTAHEGITRPDRAGKRRVGDSRE